MCEIKRFISHSQPPCRDCCWPEHYTLEPSVESHQDSTPVYSNRPVHPEKKKSRYSTANRPHDVIRKPVFMTSRFEVEEKSTEMMNRNKRKINWNSLSVAIKSRQRQLFTQQKMKTVSWPELMNYTCCSLTVGLLTLWKKDVQAVKYTSSSESLSSWLKNTLLSVLPQVISKVQVSGSFKANPLRFLSLPPSRNDL